MSPHFLMFYDITTTTLYFVRSGFITNASGRLWNPGLFGRMWSVTSSSQLFNNVANGVAYNLDVNDTTIRAVGGNARYYSFPLRCKARSVAFIDKV